MVVGRRAVGIHQHASWVFNRMVDAYAARPPYPTPLVDALVELLGADSERRALELGAGIGHLALPLAERGLRVTAVEPAKAMLDRLAERAAERGLVLTPVHAAAESLPLPAAGFELVVIADALHFLDVELASVELARVLARRGALALLSIEPADTPFMRALVELMQSSAPRRPRDMARAARQVFSVAGVRITRTQRFEDQTPVGADTLERILRSISFIGPAMNAGRFAAFIERVHALPGPAIWARTITLQAGRRRR